MTVVTYLIVLSLPFLMPFISRYLEIYMDEKIEKDRQKVCNISSYPKQNAEKVEALQILELKENPTPEQIQAAHRALIQKNHPDLGGSKYLASKINYARDVLLKSAGGGL